MAKWKQDAWKTSKNLSGGDCDLDNNKIIFTLKWHINYNTN